MTISTKTIFIKGDGTIIRKMNYFREDFIGEGIIDLLRKIDGMLRRYMKLYAKVWSFSLRHSIKTNYSGLYQETGKQRIAIVVKSPYGIYQERGFRRHFVPRTMLTYGETLHTFGDWMDDKGFEGPGMWVGENSTSHRPFVAPAVEITRQNLGLLISRTSRLIRGRNNL